MNFVHLHLHSGFSLLDGACKLEELTAEAARRGMPAVAVTDHGNLFAAANFQREATARGVNPIIGCEAYIAPHGHKNRGTHAERPNHLVLLAETDEGYQNLIQLVSAGYLDGFYYKPRIDHELLAQHSKGLVALSACLHGEVADALLSGKYDQARSNAYRLLDIFGKDNFFLEVQDHGIEMQKELNRDLVRLSCESGIPLVATNDCHYLTRSDARAQEILLCIQTGKTTSDSSRMKFQTDQFYFKTAQEMAEVFRDLPDALERTVVIAERCNVKIQRVSDPFPEFKVPDGYTADSYFEKVVREGFGSRRPKLERLAKANLLRHPASEYESRLTTEIEMIKKMCFAGYFLIVWDFIQYARAQSVPVGPGRGSAVGSLVSYALHITDVDPLQYDLLFERFLNPERISMPDIDIDFCTRRRTQVIDYVRRKYGGNNVAQIITFGTMAPKAVLRDVGRALDMPYGDVDRLAKLIPNKPDMTLGQALRQSSQLQSLRQWNVHVKELVEVALRLEGLARHASTHAAGIVISPRPLTEIVTLYRSPNSEIAIQYDMKALEHLGLLKMDLLGLTTLTVLDDAIRLIEQNRGIRIDVSALPLDDQPTYQLFARGDTAGIFQFESDGMRDILRRYRPARLGDLTALNALYRPGPIQGGMIDDFIARKHGKKRVPYDLPELGEILSETWGVIVFQEQVMKIANCLAGFSLAEADLLRRAMSKKKPEEMAAHRERFLTGCQVRKTPKDKAERIFDLMAEFADYGFNKSHSCAYGLLAYQTAYLKTHYPVEFMASLITSETGNREKIMTYLYEARGMGITVLPPDVNSSALYFKPAGDAIRFGLSAIKNVGEAAARTIVDVRAAIGKFRSVSELCGSIPARVLNKRAVESLAKAGALDSLPNASKRSISGRLAAEKEVLGMYISGHPLDGYKARLEGINANNISDLARLGDASAVTVAGVLTEFSQAVSAAGNPWARGLLEDRTGFVPLIVFSGALKRYRQALIPGSVVSVAGRVQCEKGENVKIFVDDVKNLGRAIGPD